MVEWETHFQSAVSNQDLGRVLMFHGGFARAAQALGALGMAMAGALLPGLYRNGAMSQAR